MTDRRTPLDTALDLLVFIPVGMALTVGEELPRLAAKGRAGLGGRVTTAKVVGQFAVGQGRREIDRRVRPPAPGPTAVVTPTVNATVVDAADPPPSRARTSRRAGAPGPAADGLAIPGYDSLSASQVVQRLAGLSAPELEQVETYEAATRGRRTILARIGQLQAG